MKTLLCRLTAASSMIVAGTWSLQAQQSHAPTAQRSLEQAASDGRYALLMFYRDDSPATVTMAKTVKEAVTKRNGTAVAAFVEVDDSNNATLVERFHAAGAPLPLLLVVAPNRAVTDAFPVECAAEELDRAFVTPAMASCVLGLQQGKLVFLCVSHAQPSLPQSVAEFVADPQFKHRTLVVPVAAGDPAEAHLLAHLGVTVSPSKPVSAVCFAPPGVLVGMFDAASTKSEIAAAWNAVRCCEDVNCRHYHGPQAY